jgi:hypothetical protein
MKKGNEGYWRLLFTIFVGVGLFMPLKGYFRGKKNVSNEPTQAEQKEAALPLLPTHYGLFKKGVANTGPGIPLKAEYLPGGDILLSCSAEDGGVPTYQTLRWNPTSNEAFNGQWTRTEYHTTGGIIRPRKTKESTIAGKLIVAKIPGTDKLTFAMYQPDEQNPQKDRLLGKEWGGGTGVLMPIW